MEMTSAAQVRFWSKVAKSADCWEWTGYTCHGYGHLKMLGHTWKAHRFSYALHFGGFPSHLKVLHKCDNTRCVKPDHLFLGTQADNIRDMVGKGRHRGASGEKNGRAKLSRDQVESIRASQLSATRLAVHYSVSVALIGAIRSGSVWGAVNGD
jgi:hypothetical protein